MISCPCLFTPIAMPILPIFAHGVISNRAVNTFSRDFLAKFCADRRHPLILTYTTLGIASDVSLVLKFMDFHQNFREPKDTSLFPPTGTGRRVLWSSSSQAGHFSASGHWIKRKNPWIEVQLENQRNFFISTFNRPPPSDDKYLKLFDPSLKRHRYSHHEQPQPHHPHHQPRIQPPKCELSASSNRKKKLCRIFFSLLTDHDLKQTVTGPTQGDTILDLITIECAHSLSSDSNFSAPNARNAHKKVHLFSKANCEAVRQKISEIS